MNINNDEHHFSYLCVQCDSNFSAGQIRVASHSHKWE